MVKTCLNIAKVGLLMLAAWAVFGLLLIAAWAMPGSAFGRGSTGLPELRNRAVLRADRPCNLDSARSIDDVRRRPDGRMSSPSAGRKPV